MTDYLALLRGINVGGRNRVPMRELKAALESDGLDEVATYLQSGNVLFKSLAADADELPSRLQGLIDEQFGTTTPVILRTLAEIEYIASHNPFLAEEEEFKWLHVLFLDEAPAAAAIADLDPERSPGDRFFVDGREIYLHYPTGSGRSKLTLDYFERVLGVTATGRNWNTVTKLQALLQAREDA